jgi:hypothetical protein
VPQTWNPIPTRWNRVMRVLMVALVLCVSACTTPGGSSSTPAGQPAEGGAGEAAGSQRQLRHDPSLDSTVYRVQGLDDAGTGGGEIG